ncbi:MAG: methylmalonyl-CoA carboxyltransferase, partial [Clostridia bacterium]|nr:methylmalonyl-CoA carboxyltransferase [Clostridia bacterium]
DINRLSENILNIIPDNSDGFDIRNIISEVADSSKVFEIACDFAQSIFVGFIKLNGVTVGVVANNSIKNDGEISVSSAKKASKFINFCDSFNIPIITFADCGDFSSSGCHEKQYLADSAANLIASYVNATVPKITVIVRRAYGSTYLAMGSKACGADMVFAYPTAEISIMPPEGAANIMYSEEISTSDNPIECRKQMIERYKREIASPYIAASKGYIDDIIEPDSTRPRLISAIEMLFSKRVQSAAKKHINMPL